MQWNTEKNQHTDTLTHTEKAKKNPFSVQRKQLKCALRPRADCRKNSNSTSIFSFAFFLLLFLLLLYILLAVFFNWLAESFKQRWCLLNVGCCSLLLLLLLPLLLLVFELFICGQQCKADEFAERVCRGAWPEQKLKRITRREYKMKIG